MTTAINNSHILSRFLEAQANVYPQILKELRNGKKISHWMWFIFPQIEGLGHSSTAKYYSIKTINEAKEYLQHPVLGKRLIECCNILLNLDRKTASEIFGYPDDMKSRSSMTLFNSVAPGQKVFVGVLNKYFDAEPDQKTLAILSVIGN